MKTNGRNGLCGLGGLAVVVMTLVHCLSGCVSKQVVNSDGTTNIVTVIDPVKLDKVKAAVEPEASSVLRRVIRHSPEHAKEIGDYARAIGGVMCSAQSTGAVTPGEIATAADKATQSLQSANIPDDIIDAKNALLGLYRILWDDQLTIQLPKNQWPNAVLSICCDSIDQALKDSGQTGVK